MQKNKEWQYCNSIVLIIQKVARTKMICVVNAVLNGSSLSVRYSICSHWPLTFPIQKTVTSEPGIIAFERSLFSNKPHIQSETAVLTFGGRWLSAPCDYALKRDCRVQQFVRVTASLLFIYFCITGLPTCVFHSGRSPSHVRSMAFYRNMRRRPETSISRLEAQTPRRTAR